MKDNNRNELIEILESKENECSENARKINNMISIYCEENEVTATDLCNVIEESVKMLFDIFTCENNHFIGIYDREEDMTSYKDQLLSSIKREFETRNEYLKGLREKDLAASRKFSEERRREKNKGALNA